MDGVKCCEGSLVGLSSSVVCSADVILGEEANDVVAMETVDVKADSVDGVGVVVVSCDVVSLAVVCSADVI